MSRHTLHNEENFWPCVSDMFLALFVIALVLYASASKKASKGDLLIHDQVVAETVELMETLQERLPEQRATYSSAANDIRAEHKKNRESKEKGARDDKLVKVLNALPQDKHLQGAFKKSIEQTDECNKAVNMLYRACMDTQPPAEDEMHAEGQMNEGEQMRNVRQHLIDFLDKRSDEGGGLESLIRQLRDQLAEAFNKISDLQQDVRARDETIKRLQEKLETLKKSDSTIYLHEQIAVLTNQLEKLKGELKKDTRGLIMRKVATLLDKHNLRGKVEIKESEGILRIPTSSVTFVKMDNNSTFTGKDIIKGHDVLQHLADLLKELAEDAEYGPLIESIVIEGHADSQVRNKNTRNTTNEIASSHRALLAWFYMNGTFSGQERLQHITNHNGLSLFSHSGFGDRIPVKQVPGESKDDFLLRCRRIDIRFIAAPIQVQD